MHVAGPNGQDHDPMLDSTTVIHLTDTQATIAEILGINTRGTPGHWQARLTHTEQRRIRRLQDLMGDQAAMGGDAA